MKEPQWDERTVVVSNILQHYLAWAWSYHTECDPYDLVLNIITDIDRVMPSGFLDTTVGKWEDRGRFDTLRGVTQTGNPYPGSAVEYTQRWRRNSHGDWILLPRGW